MTLQDLAQNSAIQTGGAVALALGLVEVIKTLVNKLTQKVAYGHRDRSMIHDLYKWHAPDDSGLQGWRNWGAAEVRTEFRQMVELQRKTLETLERIEAKTK